MREGTIEQVLAGEADWCVHTGDCLQVLPTIPAGSVGAVVTDPPYGTGDLAGGYGRSRKAIAGDGDLAALQAATPWLTKAIDTGWMLVFFGAKRTAELCGVFDGMEWFGELVWDKAQPGLGYHVRYAHESVAVLRIGDAKRPASPILSVLRAPPVGGEHPHEKPVSVVQPMVEWAAMPDVIVLDPFCGSGTTGVAAIKTGRRFIGIEIDPGYAEIARRRIREAEPVLFTRAKSEQGEMFR